MSKRANPALIGVFVSGAVVLAVVAIILFGSGRLFRSSERFVLYFENSVNGLEVGAPVKFKGVRIGQVREIYIRYNQAEDSAHVPVIIEIDTHHLSSRLGVVVDLANPDHLAQVIRDGLRGKLQLQSFVTGVLFVELDYYEHMGKPKLVQREFLYPEIPTIYSPNVTALFLKLTTALDEVSQINFAEMGRRAESILVTLDDGLKEIQFKEVNERIILVADAIEAFIANPELTENISLVKHNLENIIAFTDNLNAKIDPLASEIHATLGTLQTTLLQGQQFIRQAEEMISPDSALHYDLQQALSEMAGAMRSLRVLSEYLERNPNAILTGKPQPD